MSDIDFHELDGASRVATPNAARGWKTATILLFVLGGTLLLWIFWPEGSAPDSVNASEETFETSSSSISNYEPDPSPSPQADVIKLPVPGDPPPIQAADVNVTIGTGDDLAARRAAEEARLRAEMARLQAEEEARRREEELRRQEAEAKRLAEEERLKWERLRSGLIVIDGTASGGGQDSGQAVHVAEDGQLYTVPGADTDANSAFLAQSQSSRAGSVKAVRLDRPDALVPQGTLIRGFLETAINSDLPGMVRAVVREDVYSLDGRRILVPKGSRLIGEYKSGLSRGQTRIFVVWNRMIRSDGVAVDIASPGADRLGRAGMTGQINRHFVQRFGAAIMLSLIGGASEYISALGSVDTTTQQTVTQTDPVTGEVTTFTIEPSKSEAEARSIAAEKVSGTLQEIATETFGDSVNIPPTIYVAQGEPIIVFVRKDLDFADLYADPVRQEYERLKRGGKPRAEVDPVPLFMTPKDNFPRR